MPDPDPYIESVLDELHQAAEDLPEDVVAEIGAIVAEKSAELAACLRERGIGPATTPLEVVFEADAVVATATDLSLIGEGPDLASALEALCQEIEAFGLAYFARLESYRFTADRALAPFLLRFLLTPDDEQQALLVEGLKQGQAGEHSLKN